MAWVVTWPVRPFEGPTDREARRARCVELAGQGVKRAAIARELQVHPHFVWKSLLTPEQHERHVTRQRENKRATAPLQRGALRCRGCGRERDLGRDTLRKIGRGEMSGLCRACGRRGLKLVEEAPFVPLTEAELEAWAREALAGMTELERRAVASLELPEVDGSRPAHHRRASGQKQWAA